MLLLASSTSTVAVYNTILQAEPFKDPPHLSSVMLIALLVHSGNHHLKQSVCTGTRHPGYRAAACLQDFQSAVM